MRVTRKIKDGEYVRLLVVNLTSPKLECVRRLGHNFSTDLSATQPNTCNYERVKFKIIICAAYSSHSPSRRGVVRKAHDAWARMDFSEVV